MRHTTAMLVCFTPKLEYTCLYVILSPPHSKKYGKNGEMSLIPVRS